MWPDWELNPGPLTYESGALPTELCSPATYVVTPHLNRLYKTVQMRDHNTISMRNKKYYYQIPLLSRALEFLFLSPLKCLGTFCLLLPL